MIQDYGDIAHIVEVVELGRYGDIVEIEALLGSHHYLGYIYTFTNFWMQGNNIHSFNELVSYIESGFKKDKIDKLSSVLAYMMAGSESGVDEPCLMVLVDNKESWDILHRINTEYSFEVYI